MKKIVPTILISLLFANVQLVDAQVLGRLKRHAKKRVERNLEKKIDKEIDDAMSSDKKKSSKEKEENGEINKSENDSTSNVGFWMTYDFVPGKNVIFYDKMNEEDYGDFPRRWDLLKGNAEVARYGDNRELLFYNTSTSISPLIDSDNYLPEAFSIEFDIYFDDLAGEAITNYALYFNDNNYNGLEVSSWFPFEVSYKKFRYKNNGYENIPNFVGWHHVAISYHKGYLKMYFDEQKVLNIPRLDFEPAQINMIKIGYSERKDKKRVVSMKNFKIAEGGGKPYAQVIADGKFVTHGILFDTGKSILKPQSSGVIKRVMDMMIDNPDWKFEIVGHTDSDGDDESNLLLSQKRARAVKKALLDRGVDSGRLSTSGKGEGNPLNNNATPEEKANNRRVEFVLMK